MILHNRPDDVEAVVKHYQGDLHQSRLYAQLQCMDTLVTKNTKFTPVLRQLKQKAGDLRLFPEIRTLLNFTWYLLHPLQPLNVPSVL